MAHVFVYGSLMKGLGNHGHLAGARPVGAYSLPAGLFRMYSLGAFPGLVDDAGGSAVPGEVYEVDAATLATLDRLESHPSFYRRRLVDVDGFGEAWVYILAARRIRRAAPVPGNDWRAFLEAETARWLAIREAEEGIGPESWERWAEVDTSAD